MLKENHLLIRISDDLKADLKKAAKKEERTMADILREIITKYLKEKKA